MLLTVEQHGEHEQLEVIDIVGKQVSHFVTLLTSEQLKTGFFPSQKWTFCIGEWW